MKMFFVMAALMSLSVVAFADTTTGQKAEDSYSCEQGASAATKDVPSEDNAAAPENKPGAPAGGGEVAKPKAQ